MPDEPPVTLPAPAPTPRVSKPPALTAWQTVADNASTRLREVAAMGAIVALVSMHAVPGTWAAVLIALIVLPIELTRQLVKPAVAKLSGGGAALVLGVVAAHKVLTYGALGTAAVAALAGFAS